MYRPKTRRSRGASFPRHNLQKLTCADSAPSAAPSKLSSVGLCCSIKKHLKHALPVQSAKTLTKTSLTMAITPQNLLTNSYPRISFYIADNNVTPLKNPNLFLPFSLKPLRNLTPFQIVNNPSNSQIFRSGGSRIRVFQSKGSVSGETERNSLNLDSILSVVEFLCLASSAIVSVGFAVNSAVSNQQKSVMVVLGNRILLWQAVALVGGVVAGSWIRRRQWRRICKDTAKPGNESVNLVERTEKMEEDLRSLATLVRVLSRQLEKLGIRFRVTRKALRQPIAEVMMAFFFFFPLETYDQFGQFECIIEEQN